MPKSPEKRGGKLRRKPEKIIIPDPLPDYVVSEVQRQKKQSKQKKAYKKRQSNAKLAWDKLSRVLSKRKFKKSDKGRTFYIALPTAKERKQGKKYVTQGIEGTRKSFMVWVNKDGNLSVAKEGSKPIYARPLTVKVTQVAPKYISKEYALKFKSVNPVIRDKKTKKPLKDEEGNDLYRYPCMNGQNITWDRVVREVTDDLRYNIEVKLAKSDINFIIQFREVIVDEIASGEKHNFRTFTGVEFKSRALQKYRRGGLENFVSKMLYAHFAEMLKGSELVTVGSAAYIYNNFNSGKSKKSMKNWVDAKGNKWEKNEFALVKIRHICYDISSMRREVGKESSEGESIDEETY